jgi:hypothetical protein
MYTKALLVLAPVAAQAAAAQSARWPVFNLRANVTEQYIGYGSPDWCVNEGYNPTSRSRFRLRIGLSAAECGLRTLKLDHELI